MSTIPDSQQPDSPIIARDWCPGCEPDLDPRTVCVVLQRCLWHPADYSGTGDAEFLERWGGTRDFQVNPPDTDPETQRAWGKFLRETEREDQ